MQYWQVPDYSGGSSRQEDQKGQSRDEISNFPLNRLAFKTNIPNKSFVK